MNDISTSSNSRLPTVVILILGAVGVVLGGIGVSSALSGKKAVQDLQVQMEVELGASAGAIEKIRLLDSQGMAAIGQLDREVSDVKEQLSNSVSRVKSPVKGEAVKNGDQPAQPDDPNAVYHKIRPGDLLGRVAKKYGTTVDSILQLNPGLDAKHVKLGQRVRVK